MISSSIPINLHSDAAERLHGPEFYAAPFQERCSLLDSQPVKDLKVLAACEAPDVPNAAEECSLIGDETRPVLGKWQNQGGRNRRAFLRTAVIASTAPWLLHAATSAKAWRGAIIGHTGAGNYGHDLDTALTGHGNIEVVGVADPDAPGRQRAASRSGARRQYSDYREMLKTERPDLAVIAPRWSDQHHAMCMAALQAGAHLLVEKPFTVTLAEADEILALARRERRQIAVAHQMRLAPNIVHLHRSLKEGLIGDLISIRSWGKQDARAGGEDMMVLGTHIFDLIRLFAGDALWCSATVTSKGRDITRADARAATEKVGPVAGDEIEAHFGFERKVTATFTSRARLRETLGHWGLELLGSKGIVRILLDIDPQVFHRRTGEWKTTGRTDSWQPIENDPSLKANADQRGFHAANRRVVSDWLESIEHNREPQCSGWNGMKAMEMVMGVYEAALTKARVTFPLQKRTHPLA